MELCSLNLTAALFTFPFSILVLSPPSHAIIRTIEDTVFSVSAGDLLQVIFPEATQIKFRLSGCDTSGILKN